MDRTVNREVVARGETLVQFDCFASFRSCPALMFVIMLKLVPTFYIIFVTEDGLTAKIYISICITKTAHNIVKK